MDAIPPTHALPVSADRPHVRWGPWATLFWSAGAGAVMVVSQTLGAVAYLVWHAGYPNDPTSIQQLSSNGAMLATSFLLSTPFVLGFFALAVKLARVPFADYMALKWPRWRDIFLGIGALGVVLIFSGLAANLTGRETPEFMTETFRTAREAGMLPLFLLSFAVLPPVQEELFFRGFLFRGLVPSIGAWPTIVLTAAVWAVIHLQYEWFFVGEIFVLGLTFGWLRQRSGSTILTMLLHGGMNTLALLEASTLAPS